MSGESVTASTDDSHAGSPRAGLDSREATGNAPVRSWVVVAALASTVMTPMGVALVSPTLPAAKVAFGISDARVGLFITGYALPSIVVAPFVGRLADRIGRRRVLAGCLVAFGLAGTAVAAADSFQVALGLRVLQGFAAGTIVSALAMTLIGDKFRGRRRNAVMGLAAASISIGAAIYPLVGGTLSSVHWNLPFVLFLIPVGVGVLVLIVLDDDRSEDPSDSGPDPTLRATVRALQPRRAVQLYGLLVVTYVLVFGGVYTLVPLYLGRAFGLSTARIGLVTSLALLVTATVATANGRLVRRVRPRSLVAAGYGCYAVGLVGIGLAARLPVAVGALVVFGAGSGLVSPTLYAGVSDLAPTRFRASTMTIQTTMVGTGQAIGPALFTTLAAVLGAGATLLAGGTLAAAGAVVIFRLVRVD